MSSNSGRTISNGQIVDYNGSETSFISNNWKLNALSAFRISYSFSERFAISSGVQLQKSLMNWSLEENIQMRPIIYNIAIGIDYTL